MNPHIRWMIRRDMPEVLEIEAASFSHPWTQEDFLRCLRQRNCIGMVAEVEEKVVGFMLYELHKTKLHLLNFVVHPDFRRQGVGLILTNKLKSKLSSHRPDAGGPRDQPRSAAVLPGGRLPGHPRPPRLLRGHRGGCLPHAVRHPRVVGSAGRGGRQ